MKKDSPQPKFKQTKVDLNVCETEALGQSLDKSVVNSIENKLKGHYKEILTKKYIEEHGNQLSREGYTKISDILPHELMNDISKEFIDIIEKNGRRIDIEIEVTDNSPRKMITVNHDQIINSGRLIPHLYYSDQMRSFLTQITKHHVYDCPYDSERMTGTKQTMPGDTHGWHWGDHQYAVIFIITAPSIEHGGMLQNVPHTTWDKENPKIYQKLNYNPIITHYHSSGDIYLFKTDTTLHRTYPLQKEGERIIMNFTYSGPDDLLKNNSHETMDKIFDF